MILLYVNDATIIYRLLSFFIDEIIKFYEKTLFSFYLFSYFLISSYLSTLLLSDCKYLLIFLLLDNIINKVVNHIWIIILIKYNAKYRNINCSKDRD